MNKKRIGIFIAVIFALIAGVFIFRTIQGRLTSHSASVNAKVARYVCPMHPHVHSDHPSECPICGMDLVPDLSTSLDAAAVATTPSRVGIDLSSERIQAINVKIGKAQRRSLFKKILVPGRLAFDPELYTAQKELAEAVKQAQSAQASPSAELRESADRMVESARSRLRVLGLSEVQIKKIAEAGTVEETATDTAWVYADVSEIDLQWVKPGLAVEATVAGSGVKLLGKVVAVDRVLQSTSKTAKARIALFSKSQAAGLHPESSLDVVILAPLGLYLAIPSDAVVETGRDSWVYVTDGKGHFEPHRLTVRVRVGDWVGVSSGINENDSIALSGNFLLDSESRLKAGSQ